MKCINCECGAILECVFGCGNEMQGLHTFGTSSRFDVQERHLPLVASFPLVACLSREQKQKIRIVARKKGPLSTFHSQAPLSGRYPSELLGQHLSGRLALSTPAMQGNMKGCQQANGQVQCYESLCDTDHKKKQKCYKK